MKKTLKRIIAAAVLTVLLALLLHFVELPWFVQPCAVACALLSHWP